MLRDGTGLKERGVWVAGEGVACWSECEFVPCLFGLLGEGGGGF